MHASDIAAADDAVEKFTITPKDERRSGLFMTRFEIAKVVGERARQISTNTLVSANAITSMTSPERLGRNSSSNGGSSQSTPRVAPIKQKWSRHDRSAIFEMAERVTDPLSRVVDPVLIAKHELVEKRIRMVIKRTYPNGRCENIPVNELEVDETFLDLKY